MRCRRALCSLPFQYAPATESSLKALMREAEGTCGPRQKSMNCGPSAYSEKRLSAFSLINSSFIQSSEYFRRPSSLGVMMRSNGRPLDSSPRSEEHTSDLQSHHELVCR